MGQTQSGLADQLQVSRQAMSKYLNGERGTPSKFITELLAITDLQIEQVVFPNSIDHPDGENEDCPAYWANIAIEALREAQKRGLTCQEIIANIVQETEKTISEIYP